MSTKFNRDIPPKYNDPIIVTEIPIELRSNADILCVEDPHLYRLLLNACREKQAIQEQPQAVPTQEHQGPSESSCVKVPIDSDNYGPSSKTDAVMKNLQDKMLEAFGRKDVVKGAEVLCRVLHYMAPGQANIAHMVRMFGALLGEHVNPTMEGQGR